MAKQLFYGKIDSFSTPVGNGSNGYIRVRFDAATTSTTLENVTDVGGYFFGKIFKGPKLTKISPKKTYTGMIGGFLLSLICLINSLHSNT